MKQKFKYLYIFLKFLSRTRSLIFLKLSPGFQWSFYCFRTKGRKNACIERKSFFYYIIFFQTWSNCHKKCQRFRFLYPTWLHTLFKDRSTNRCKILTNIQTELWIETASLFEIIKGTLYSISSLWNYVENFMSVHILWRKTYILHETKDMTV